ncbi:MAG: hypothetical protein O2960_03345 [Verrucomicrobia bacterium]|nr:hypothetical protein [Verrucomicrobiota bacterium]
MNVVIESMESVTTESGATGHMLLIDRDFGETVGIRVTSREYFLSKTGRPVIHITASTRQDDSRLNLQIHELVLRSFRYEE